MKKISTLLIGAVMIFFIGCDTETATIGPDGKTFTTSMEGDGWMNPHTIIQGFGHTGAYCSKVDTVNRFSYGITRLFKEIDSTSVPRRVEVSFWTLFKKTGITTNLVISVDNSTKNVFWAGMDLKDKVKKADEWTFVSLSYSLPAETKGDDRISVYLWNPNNNTAFIDDLSVKFLN